MPEERGKQRPRPQVSGDVLVHIEQRGSLQGFPASRQEKLALMKGHDRARADRVQQDGREI
jgi:hypothetical protein